ncbi:hypothetical protein MTO96_005086 [Rhipicephalus appendiculatus]
MEDKPDAAFAGVPGLQQPPSFDFNNPNEKHIKKNFVLPRKRLAISAKRKDKQRSLSQQSHAIEMHAVKTSCEANAKFVWAHVNSVPLKFKWPEPEDVKCQDEEKRRRQKKDFDSRHAATILPPLEPGDTVWVRDIKEMACVLSPASKPRSYVYRKHPPQCLCAIECI